MNEAPPPEDAEEIAGSFNTFTITNGGEPKSDHDLKYDKSVVSKLHKLTNETRNPLYIWKTISYCAANEMPIPKFCLNYLFGASVRISNIIDLFTSSTPKNRMKSDKAVRMFVDTLLFTSGKKNPFQRIAADEDALHAAAISEWVRVAPKDLLARLPIKTQTDALRAIKVIHYVEHDRSAKRLITQGNKLRNL